MIPGAKSIKYNPFALLFCMELAVSYAYNSRHTHETLVLSYVQSYVIDAGTFQTGWLVYFSTQTPVIK